MWGVVIFKVQEDLFEQVPYSRGLRSWERSHVPGGEHPGKESAKPEA